MLRTGKLPARQVDSDVPFSKYRTSEAILPRVHGHGNTFSNWGMNANGPDPTVTYANFQGAGCCVFAGGDHETENWTNLGAGGLTGQEVVTFTGMNTLSDYSAVTKYDPTQTDAEGNNPTDQGTDVHDALEYRMETGLVDSTGNRHKLYNYVTLDPKSNWEEFLQAIFVFDAVGIGINFPGSAMDQFNEGLGWSVVKGSKIDGGHYIPVVGFDQTAETVTIITWGKRITATKEFILEYCDESYGLMSAEAVEKNGKTYEGFDLAQLQSDLANL